MDAHDKLFYRLNDPDPHTQAMAELDLLDGIFGKGFVERWLEWNGLEDALRAWRSKRLPTATPTSSSAHRTGGPA